MTDSNKTAAAASDNLTAAIAAADTFTQAKNWKDNSRKHQAEEDLVRAIDLAVSPEFGGLDKVNALRHSDGRMFLSLPDYFEFEGKRGPTRILVVDPTLITG